MLKDGHRAADPVVLRAERLTKRAETLSNWAIGISLLSLALNIYQLVHVLVRHYA